MSGDETKNAEQKDGGAADDDDDDGVTNVRHIEDDCQQVSLPQQQVEADSDHHQRQRLPTKQCIKQLFRAALSLVQA